MRSKLALIFMLVAGGATAQQNNLYLNHQVHQFYEARLQEKGVTVHTSIRPWRMAEIDTLISYDSVFRLQRLPGEKFPGKLVNWIAYDNMVQVNTSDFHLSIDPLINFSGGIDLEDNKGLWVNTRGLTVSGDIGEKKKVSFNTTFRENQAKYPTYLTSWIKDYDVVPGQGKVRSFKGTAFDYANSSGYVSYSPNSYFNFQLGHDKNFIGEGYRSMILSDNAFFYPFLKINTSVWRIRYMNLYTQFTDAINGADSIIGVTRKWGSFHYLSFDAWDWAQIGLFEGIIWPNNDSTLTRGFDPNYLNPIIFFRPVEFGLGSPDNALMGLNLKLKPMSDLIIYGQFLMDDLDVAAARNGEGYYRNKFGMQAGVKYFLHTPDYRHAAVVLAEWNQANPYTYAHKEPVQNYAPLNQPLAHPLGANFREFIIYGSYRLAYRYYASGRFQVAMTGLDSSAASNVGSNIFLSDFTIPGFPDSYGNFVGQGLETHIFSADLRAGYLVNPKINLNLEGQIFYRTYANDDRAINTLQFMLGLKTDIFNQYYDL
ncbi:MAG TPA: hypothetical protein PLI89_08360 [Chitinophagales bacterium]|nr:hypothetical protein [Chitinophagales bacterium]